MWVWYSTGKQCFNNYGILSVSDPYSWIQQVYSHSRWKTEYRFGELDSYDIRHNMIQYDT